MTDKTAPQPKTAPPSQVRNAAIALAVSGLGALVAALTLLGQKDWIESQRLKAIKKVYDDSKKTAKDLATYTKDKAPSALHDYSSQQLKGSLITSAVAVLLAGFLAYSVYKGRHWSRWGVIGVWVLSILTGSFASLLVLLGFLTGSGVPAAFRIPVVVSGVAYLVAVVLVCLRPSVEYFALSKPAGANARPARSGLFGPRVRTTPTRPGVPTGSSSASSSAKSAPKTPAAAKADLTKATASTRPATRTKQRAGAEAVAKGADLARSRAKAASKSRRTGS